MNYLKTSQLSQIKVNTKKCRTCKEELPVKDFPEKSRSCIRCLYNKKVEQMADAYHKRITSIEKKKAKVVTVVKISELKKAVQKKINKYVRERDKDLPCISCGKPAEEKEAGHYIAQGSSGLLRYNTDNIHGQCTSCNRWKHGNLLEYRIGLIRKIGGEKVDWLEAHRHDQKHWTREDLQVVVDTLSRKEV